jgi:hypothetical protein
VGQQENSCKAVFLLNGLQVMAPGLEAAIPI